MQRMLRQKQQKALTVDRIETLDLSASCLFYLVIIEDIATSTPPSLIGLAAHNWPRHGSNCGWRLIYWSKVGLLDIFALE